MITKMRFLFFIALFMFTSCKELTGENTGANDIKGDNIISGVHYVSLEENKILLEGTMDDAGRSSHLFKLRFLLPETKQISFSFFASEKLSGGVQTVFSRVDGVVQMEMILNGLSHIVDLDSITSDTVELAIDIHNDHADAHILIWDLNGPYEDEEECVEDGGCLYNTEFYTDPNPGPWGTQGQAGDQFWGIEGDKDLILEIEGPLEAISNA